MSDRFHVSFVFLPLAPSRYELGPEVKGAFLCDAWSGSYANSKGEERRRAVWHEVHNILPPRVQPGGWSSHGQPVDQLHAAFRREIRQRDVCSVGMVADLRSRPRTLDSRLLYCMLLLIRVPYVFYVFFPRVPC